MAVFYLNRGFILEQEIVKALKTYFGNLKLKNMYNGNFDVVNITNEHPFAALIQEGDGFSVAGKFPAVVVSTAADRNGITMLPQNSVVKYEAADLDRLAAYGYMIAPETVGDIQAATAERGYVFGIQIPIRRTEQISVEIWCENIQLKNELYEMVRLFLCGYMNDYITGLYPYCNFAVFKNSVTGQRSNNWNFEFGVALSGAQLVFDADYIVEQTIIDTVLTDVNKDIYVEVANHVKNG